MVQSGMLLVRKYIVLLLLVVLVVVGGLAIYYYRAAQSNAPQSNNQANIVALVAKVGQLIVLPQGETPTVATVVDPNVLKSQPFFANAAKGDLVLIYTAAKKAILYDPSVNKIVEVAPVTIGTSAAASNNPSIVSSSTEH